MKDEIKKEQIVFLGEATFPAGLAAIQRMTLMAKALITGEYEVTVLCRKGGSRANGSLNFSAQGTFEGINYTYTSGNIFRPKGFLKRNFLKIKGMINEFIYLRRLKRTKGISAAIISNHSAFHVFRYRVFSWLIGFPIVLNFVELASSMKGREKLLTKINDFIFDHFIVRIVDGALPISNKLMTYYKAISPKKPSLKLPILCDFEKFNLKSTSVDDVVFLYCGAASYLELINFIINAFNRIKNPGDKVILELILGGKEAELNKVVQIIDTAANRNNIRLITNVDHKDIPQYFVNATALLIPLRPSVQDEARFPHKIGEYLASGRPMITTRFGEIRNYDFIDKVTALVADDYDVKSYSEKMEYIVGNPLKADEIGKKGRQMGYNNFNYTNYGKILREYFTVFKN